MRAKNGGTPWGVNFVIIQGNLSANIRLLREEQEMSQIGLSCESGVGQQELSNIERMVANPSVEALTKIAAALDVPICRLFQSPALSVPNGY
jgi:transcriptional regulator with XRE-family HTH domain